MDLGRLLCMNGSGTRAVLVLLGLSVVCRAQAAAGQSTSPDSVSPRAQPESQLKPPSLTVSEDEFLSPLEKHTVSGGPPKDGIPAIEEPRYTSAAEAEEWHRHGHRLQRLAEAASYMMRFEFTRSFGVSSGDQASSHSAGRLPCAGMPPAADSILARCIRFQLMNVTLRCVN